MNQYNLLRCFFSLSRLPQRGMLQIVIRNPSKIPVKTLLIKFDFSEMPVGSKTFIRQKTVTSKRILQYAGKKKERKKERA